MGPFSVFTPLIGFYRVSYASTVLAVIVCLSVCLSVRLSVTSRSFTKVVKPKITLTTPYDSPGTVVFWRQNSSRNSNYITHNGAPKRSGIGSHRRFFDQYLAISEIVQDKDILAMEG